MDNNIIFSILLILIGIFLGIITLVIINYIKGNSASKKAEKLLEKAKKEAEKIKKDFLLEAKEEEHKLKIEIDKEIKNKKAELGDLEEKLLIREGNIERRDQTLQKKQKNY